MAKFQELKHGDKFYLTDSPGYQFIKLDPPVNHLNAAQENPDGSMYFTHFSSNTQDHRIILEPPR